MGRWRSCAGRGTTAVTGWWGGGRLLGAAGREVEVVCVAPVEELSGDARESLSRLPGDAPVRLLGGDESELGQQGAGAIERATVIVDALLGTGFQGEPRGVVAEAIDAANAAKGSVVGVGVPRGGDAPTGVVSGPA